MDLISVFSHVTLPGTSWLHIWLLTQAVGIKTIRIFFEMLVPLLILGESFHSFLLDNFLLEIQCGLDSNSKTVNFKKQIYRTYFGILKSQFPKIVMQL